MAMHRYEIHSTDFYWHTIALKRAMHYAKNQNSIIHEKPCVRASLDANRILTSQKHRIQEF